MTSFRLILPISELHNSNDRGASSHWAVVARKRKAMRAAAKEVCQHIAAVPGRVSLTVTFQFPDNRWRDLDNYEIKGAIDGMVDAGVISDDKRQVLGRVTREDSDVHSAKGFVALTFDIEARP